MTSLRTVWGTDFNFITDSFPESFSANFEKESAPYLKNKMMIKEKNIFSLTNKGKLFADKIASVLFITK